MHRIRFTEKGKSRPGWMLSLDSNNAVNIKDNSQQITKKISNLEPVALDPTIRQFFTLKHIDISSREIPAYQFYACNSLESVNIAEPVETIGRAAFKECINLKSIQLPDSLTKIEVQAFFDCTVLSAVEIPDSVKYIEDQAFAYCESLETVDLPKSIRVIGLKAFTGTPIASIRIPNTISVVGKDAFTNCFSLKKIFVPDERVERIVLKQNPSYANIIVREDLMKRQPLKQTARRVAQARTRNVHESTEKIWQDVLDLMD